MGFLDKLKTYGSGSWKKVSEETFSAKEAARIKQASVIDNDYGRLQVCFLMADGTTKYGQLSRKSSLVEGQVIALNSLKQITLERDGEYCYKFDGEAQE